VANPSRSRISTASSSSRILGATSH
jgi:hypothetical protein